MSLDLRSDCLLVDATSGSTASTQVEVGNAILLAQGSADEAIVYWYDRTWNLSLLWIIVAFLAISGFIIWNYRRESRLGHVWVLRLLIGLRLGTISILLLAMLGWVRYGAQTDQPDLVIAFDVSESMNHVDTPTDSDVKPLSRIEDVADKLSRRELDQLRKLSQRYNLHFYEIGQQAKTRPATLDSEQAWDSLSAEDKESRLGETLQQILDVQRGRPTAAVVVFTDGVTTAGITISDSATRFVSLGIPLFCIGVGDEEPPRDHRLFDLRADEFVFVDDLVTFEAQLQSVGLEGRQAVVQLSHSGDSAILDEQRIEVVDEDQLQRIQLQHRPMAEGVYEYQVRVLLDDDEAIENNNSVVRRITVKDETLRVLLVQDEPSYEYRALKRMLERRMVRGREAAQQSIELTTVLQSAQVEYASTDRSAIPLFPIRREELFEFDVVILADLRPDSAGLSSTGLGMIEMENLQEFVTVKGGGLILIAGPRFMPHAFESTPLAPLLPYPPGKLSPDSPIGSVSPIWNLAPTEVGLAMSPMLIADTPQQSRKEFESLGAGYWVAKVDELKPGVVLLAETEQRTNSTSGKGWPLITFQRIGPGRVLTHFFDESYRWRVDGGEFYFARYWNQAIRFLGREKLHGSRHLVEFVTDRTEYRDGESIELTARYLDPDRVPRERIQTAVIKGADGRQRSIELRADLDALTASESGVSLRGEVRELPPGEYEAMLWEDDASTSGDFGEQPSTRFKVLEPLGEKARLQMAGDELREAAKLTRGAFFTLAEVDQVWDKIPKGEKVTLAPIPPVSLWNMRWPLIAVVTLFAATLCGEWVLRKRVDLS